MKKYFICMAFAALILPMKAQLPEPRRADPQQLTHPDAFTFVLLGDPQGYTKYDVNQPLFDLCTAWIADNLNRLNIKGVLCTGDLVEQNENIVPQRHTNQTGREMWEAASRAFARLDGKTPYIISCGNHDYGYLHSENSMTHFPEYFPMERNPLWKTCCVDAIPNRNGIPSLENAAFEFTDPNWGGILIITSEFYPRDEVLDWAGKLAASERFRNHTVIFMTHGYMETQKEDARLIDRNEYALEPGNTGVQIWEKLLRPSENIRLLICGHTANDNNIFAENVAFRVDRNASGRNVYQMMFNVQTLGGGWEGNGGDGWLRLLEFMPDGRTIKVRTYSPLFGISPTTRHLAYRNEPYDRFDIVIDDLVATCGEDRVMIIDAAQSDGENINYVWQWNTADPTTALPKEYRDALPPINDCKSVNGNSRILFTGGSAVALIDRTTRKCLFYARTPNSHSADILPGNRVAVALSISEGGNSLEVYDYGTPGRLLFRDTLYSGHGAVWNDARQRLYVLGYNVLREYALHNWTGADPSLNKTREWQLPEDDGHDLSRISKDKLLVTATNSVYIFDISEETFTPFEPLAGIPEVKSVNFDETTGRLVFTKAEEEWWTRNIYFRNPEKTLTIPNVRLYKTRVISSSK